MRASQGADRGGVRGCGEERGQQNHEEEAATDDSGPVQPVQVRRVQ